MDLKFYLNKFAKIDRVEDYTLKALFEIKKTYESFLDKTEGHDPDFPETDFSGGKKGKKIKGVNKAQVDEDLGEETEDLGRLGGYDDSSEALQLRKDFSGDGKIRTPNRGRKTKGKKN